MRDGGKEMSKTPYPILVSSNWDSDFLQIVGP